jgi:protein ImuA
MGRDTRLSRGESRARVEELRRHLGLFSFDGDDAASSFRRQGFSPELSVRAGGIVEWLWARDGGGAFTAALPIVARCWEGRGQGFWAMVDGSGEFYMTALLGWGVDPARTLIVRPRNLRETCWAIEQCLRCPGVSATCVWLDRPVSLRAHRRWQLAADEGGGAGFIFRPACARREPVWADLRLLVTPLALGTEDARWVQIEVLYHRGDFGGIVQTWEIDHAAGLVRLVPEVADSKTASRAARSETV